MSETIYCLDCGDTLQLKNPGPGMVRIVGKPFIEYWELPYETLRVRQGHPGYVCIECDEKLKKEPSIVCKNCGERTIETNGQRDAFSDNFYCSNCLTSGPNPDRQRKIDLGE